MLLTFSSRGTLPMRVIGERLMVHPTSATNIIDRLEGQGLVVRRPNPQDGRGKLAGITDRGREVVGRATADLMQAEFGLAGFDEAQRDQLFDLLRGLRVAAGDFVPAPAADQLAVPRCAAGRALLPCAPGAHRRLPSSLSPLVPRSLAPQSSRRRAPLTRAN